MLRYNATQLQSYLDTAAGLPWHVCIAVISTSVATLAVALYAFVYLAAPKPRLPRPEEYTYLTVDEDGEVVGPRRLPCWHDEYVAACERRDAARRRRRQGMMDEKIRRRKMEEEKRQRKIDEKKRHDEDEEHEEHEDEDEDGDPSIEPPEVFMSVVVPAYNEQDRLGAMLEEAVAFLDEAYPRPEHTASMISTNIGPSTSTSTSTSTLTPQPPTQPPNRRNTNTPSGYEILLISDGSTDATIPTALRFASTHPHTPLRVIALHPNRGKGGAVAHGLRHARGLYALFADADGATRFSDLRHLVAACARAQAQDPRARGRAIAIGSRAHLVGTSAVVRRSWARNFLMHGFHLLLRVMTTPRTSAIADTQCGFKVLSRGALGAVVPRLRCEGWIFDVEMLMRAEGAGVPVVEVAVGWREVGGSKLNVLRDSLGMAWGLGVLRVAAGLGVVW